MTSARETPDTGPTSVPPTVRLDPEDTRGGHGNRPGALPSAPRRGQQIGRFIVLDTLGVGGMGVVVSAYDPQLDRKVALKLLRPDVAPAEGSSGARARLLREAQAMAKLRHPNAVAVFEVGEYGEQVFLAMEYVAGGNLIRWCAEQRTEPRGWRQILGAFMHAGRGLAAAHDEGLVHRDFKPANVLVEGDRFQVTDFGIASIAGREVLSDLGLRPRPRQDPDGIPLTQSGALVGTTPYMAPELIAGGPANAASDQFAFCVALFECLYGRRPFVGHSNADISQSITEGRITTISDDLGVPEWVRRALMRGLSPRPEDRFASMTVLVQTLMFPDEAEVGRRTRVVIAAAIGVLFTALPLVAKALGPPFDRSTYAGVISQTLALVVMLLGMAYAARSLVAATALNRKAFAAVLAVLTMQVPLELTHAALGVSVVSSDIVHLVLWGAMASMFAVTVDRRFVGLAATYLLGVPLATKWPEHHLLVLGLSNAIFVAFVVLIWRGTRTDGEPLPRSVATTRL